MRVAAVQLSVSLGDVDANLAACERLASEAAAGGATLIALPEFFSSGAAFLPEVAQAALPEDGPAAAMMRRVASKNGVTIGGSFLCRDGDGEVRNAFLLVGPDGQVLGRHDKDLPTMWENALYIGGHDDGVIDAGGITVGAAVCWEYMRAATARRLSGRVDVVMGGSNWWSIPRWPPRGVTARMEARNAENALAAPAAFGRYVGAPVVHAAICGSVACPMPEMPALMYRGHFQGGALIADADGTVLAMRRPGDGEGVVIADVEVGRRTPDDSIPDRFWLHRRGVIPAVAWHSQRVVGRRWYRKHIRHGA